MTNEEKQELLAEITAVRGELVELVQRTERLEAAVNGDEALNLLPVRREVDDLKITVNRAKWFLAGLAAANVGTVSAGVAWITGLLQGLR